MSRLRTRFVPAAILAAVVLVAAYVFQEQPPAGWLRVEAPAAVIPGEPFVVTVTLLEPTEARYLDFDLHGQDAHRDPLRCVAAGKSQAVTTTPSVFTFALMLRDRPEMERVHAVVYLSTTGQWQDAVRVAKSDVFPVVRGPVGENDRRVGDLVVRDQVEDPATEVPNPPAARASIAVIWLIGVGIAGFAWSRHPAPRGTPLLGLLFLALATWEATAAGAWIEQAGRSLTLDAGLYEARRDFQQIATVVGVAIVGVLGAAGLRRSRNRVPALVLVGLAGYAAVELAGMLSLHEIDRVLGMACGPVPVAVVLRASATATVVLGMALKASAPIHPGP